MNPTQARADLARRLAERIAMEGPLPFADFMEAALYDERAGFYADPPIGREGHYVTSPHVSTAFADLLARQLAQCWELLGRPGRFDVVELAAGDGTLARGILRALEVIPELSAATRYVGVERSAGARAALEAAGLDARAELPGEIRGVVIANELLDNIPFHRLRERDGRVLEVRVGVEGERFVEVESEPVDGLPPMLAAPLEPGEERAVAPARDALVRELAAALRRGYAILIDYHRGRGAAAPVQAFHGQQVSADVLEDPGSRDITVAVDLEEVAGVARDAGLQAWGPVSQREALLALGYRLWSSGVHARQAEAQARGDAREANRLYAERSSATILLDETKLGGLSVLALGTSGLEPPALVLGDRAVGC